MQVSRYKLLNESPKMAFIPKLLVVTTSMTNLYTHESGLRISDTLHVERYNTFSIIPPFKIFWTIKKDMRSINSCVNIWYTSYIFEF